MQCMKWITSPCRDSTEPSALSLFGGILQTKSGTRTSEHCIPVRSICQASTAKGNGKASKYWRAFKYSGRFSCQARFDSFRFVFRHAIEEKPLNQS